MANYQTPGVYVEEISTLAPSVAEVETAIPAFIGFTQFGDKVPLRITSLVEYKQNFGGADPEKNISVTIDKNTGVLTDVSVNTDTRSKNVMYYAMKLYFANGGGPCYITSTGNFRDSAKASLDVYSAALDALEKEDEPTILIFPDAPYLLKSDNYYALMVNALEQCTKLKDRFLVIDVLQDVDYKTSVDNFRNIATSDIAAPKYGAAYYPYLNTLIPYEFDDNSFIPAGAKPDVAPPAEVAGGPAPAPAPAAPAAAPKGKPAFLLTLSNSMQNQIKQKVADIGVELTPCAAVAGVYAGVDGMRGVWKAPANVSLNYVKSTVTKITDDQQNGLNIDVESGKSINAIRSFKGKGNIIWGARTLAGNDNEWRYINVRRFFNMVEESVKRSTSWAVFEPNDINTWVKVRAMIENYLLLKWKDGALMGAKPDDAFFVRVGLGQTMSPQDVLEGRMIIEIGMAAVRPAEFIILKFSHFLPKS